MKTLFAVLLFSLAAFAGPLIRNHETFTDGGLTLVGVGARLSLGERGLSSDGGIDVTAGPVNAPNSAGTFATVTTSGALTANSSATPTAAAGTARVVTTSGAVTQWITAANVNGCQVDAAASALSCNNLGPASGVMQVGSAALTNAANSGTVTLSSGTGTATVNTGARCVCSQTTSVTLGVRCSVSGTTMTATSGVGADVIAYHCF